MKAATRTTVVTASGAGAFFVAGPVGAVAGGIAAGTTYDSVHSIATDK